MFRQPNGGRISRHYRCGKGLYFPFGPSGGAHPEIAGYFEVTVPDSCDSNHGPTDPRAAKPGGIGPGTERFYIDSNGVITGYTWSTTNSSEYDSVSAGYLAAIGRWEP